MKQVMSLAAICIFMLTGCGVGATKTMSCTYRNTSNNLTTKMSYSIDYQGKEVKKLRVTYDYHQDTTNDAFGATNETTNNGTTTNGATGNATTNGTTNNGTATNGENTDGVGTGTDGTTNDNFPDNDGIVDGIVGSAIDSIINGVTGTILDIAGLRDRHTNVQNTYGNMTGFSVQNTNDATDNDYRVTYVIDYDSISDADLATLNLSRDIDTLRTNYTNQGFTCAE